MEDNQQSLNGRGRRRGIRRPLLVLGGLTVAGVLAATLTPALASDTAGGQRIRNEATGLCVTADDGGAVSSTRCGSDDHQRWIVSDAGQIIPGYHMYALKNAATNQCLVRALSDSELASPPPAIPLRTVACKLENPSDPAKQWYGPKVDQPKNSKTKWINWRPKVGCLDSDQPDASGERAEINAVKCTDDVHDTSQNWLMDA